MTFRHFCLFCISQKKKKRFLLVYAYARYKLSFCFFRIRMDDLGRILRKIIDEVEYESTLQRAAEISPFITKRTIGPDLPEYTLTKESNCENNYKEKEKEKKNCIKDDCGNSEKNSNASASKQPSESLVITDEILCPCENTNNPDLYIIRSGIIRLQTEEQTKRDAVKGLMKMSQRHEKLRQEKLLYIKQESEECRRKWLEKKFCNEAKIIQLAEAQALKDIQEYDRKLDIQRKKTQRELQKISYHYVLQYHMKFKKKYEKINSFLMCLNKQTLISCDEFNAKLRDQVDMFEKLINKIKTGNCEVNELSTAEMLYSSLDVLERNIFELYKQQEGSKQGDVNIILKEKQQQQQKPKEQQQQSKNTTRVLKEKEQKQQEISEPQDTFKQQIITALSPEPQSLVEIANTITTKDSQNPPVSCVSAECLEYYTKINNLYLEKVEKVKVLQSDESMKKYRLECQKSINLPINALSAINKEHLKDKYDKLCKFVLSQNDLGRDYCVLLMAKRFVGQGETTISSNPTAAFPVASVIVALWKLIPEFGQIFLAYIFKESPFMVPYFVQQKPGQSFEEYAKILGYRVVDDHVEEQTMYLKRQAGIARLYAAVIISNGCQEQAQQQQDKSDSPYLHPYDLENAWCWLVNILQLTPLPDICATIITEFLLTLGHDLWKTYGKQFTKLLIYMHKHYLPNLSKVDHGGPEIRLEMLLNSMLKEGKISKPLGILPPNFW